MTNINTLLNHEIDLADTQNYSHLVGWLDNLKGIRTSYHLQKYASAILHNYVLWEHTGEDYVSDYTDGIWELKHYNPDQIVQVFGDRSTIHDIIAYITITPSVKAGFKYGIKDSDKSFCLTKTQGGFVIAIFESRETTFYYYGKIALESNKSGIKREIYNDSNWMIRTQLDTLETPYSKSQDLKISLKPTYPGEEEKFNHERLKAGVEAIYKTYVEILLNGGRDKEALHDIIEFSASITDSANKLLKRI